jgi:hypothetical protein
MKNLSLTLLLVLFFSSYGVAQVPGGVKGYNYWFSSEESRDTLKFKETDKLLNFRVVRKIDNQYKFEKIINERDSEEATVFIVLKPAFPQERSLIADFTVNDRKISIQSDRVQSKEELKIKSFISEKPFLVSYTEFIKPDSTKSHQEASSEREKGFEGEVAELIYYPKFLSKVKRRKVETYLALKHGISLAPGADYINSAGDTIRKGNENELYSNRVTAIGWDSGANFNNTQSSNVDDYPFLTIGFGEKIEEKNSKNPIAFSDRNYLIWSDNGRVTEFEINPEKELLLLNRIWLAKKIGDAIHAKTITIRFDFSSSEGEKEEKENELFYWLLTAPGTEEILDTYQADYRKATRFSKETIEFSEIFLSEFDDTFLFTLAKAPEWFALVSQENVNCTTTVKLRPIGGLSPYSVLLYDEMNQQFSPYESNGSEFIFNNLSSGNYTYRITDERGKQLEEEFLIKTSSSEELMIPDIYLTKNQTYDLNLTTFSQIELKEVKWSRNDRDFGIGREKRLDKEGDYQVHYRTATGCLQSASFKVFELPEQDWSGIYPNPVKAGEDFFIKLPDNLSPIIQISIADPTGRILKTKTLSSGTGIYADRFPESGIYIITIEGQDQKQHYTIIIN